MMDMRQFSGPHWRRILSGGAVAIVVAAALNGVAGAAPATDTTNVDFVPITPHQVWGNHALQAGATGSVVVIGGSTTVPTNATTVQLSVTVKGAAAGTLSFFPAGNPAGGAGHTVSWSAGQTRTATTAEHIGLKNMMSVTNSSARSASVTIKVVGYSTQVVAGDINGSGGTAGQVITNDGAGGASWQTPSPAYGAVRGTDDIVPIPQGLATKVLTASVPAGSYLAVLSGTFTAQAGQTTDRAGVACHILSNGSTVATARDTIAVGEIDDIFVQGLLTTGGGDVTVWCSMLKNNGSISEPVLSLVQVGSVSATTSAP